MKKAFTLVEILVVVTIMSLLASIAAVSYSQFVKQSRDARRKTDIEQIRAAIELYRNFKGEYPTPGMVFGTDQIVDGSTVYMSKIPNDPKSPSYIYFYNRPTSTDYNLCAYVEGEGEDEGFDCGASKCSYCMGPYGQK